METTPAQDEFVRRFKVYMANDSAYKPLADYIQQLHAEDSRLCLSIYFDVSKDYVGRDEHRRALTVFYDLSLKSLAVNNKYFALRYEALVEATGQAWQRTYVELNSNQQHRLQSQISRQKAVLSLIERRFIAEFEKVPNPPNQKAVSEFTSKLKKNDQLEECLLVYVEISRKYSDTDGNSLLIFYGVSLQALWSGDSYFAARYESLVTSADTIWKRRFDALDAQLREGKLKPTIAEQKKISIEKKDKINGKEVTAQEKFTVPAVSHVPADIEGSRPSPAKTSTQREYVARFKKFMDLGEKPEAFTNYIFELKASQLQECVEAYLEASVQYGDSNQRSLYIFFGTASLAIAKSDAYYSFKFVKSKDSPGTLLAKRVGALSAKQQDDLKKEIAKKSKATRILDDLKLAYFERTKKEPTLQTLRAFEFAVKSETSEQSQRAFSTSLESCGRAFTLANAEDFSTRFDAFNAFLFTSMDPLMFVSLLKRCREEKSLPIQLRHQFYWFMVGVLYLQTLKVRPEAYRTGFSAEEKQFLFDEHDTSDPYFSDFAIRLDYLWLRSSGPDQYIKVSKGYMGLLLLASKMGATLSPMVEAALVRGVVEKMRKERPRFMDAIRIPINSRYSRSKSVKVGQTVGRFFVVWWEQSLGAYVETEAIEDVLFRVDSYDWLGRVSDNDAVWGEIYRGTSYLLVVIPFIFELLGYLPDLVTGGVTGLAKSIFLNIAIGKTVDKLGLNANAVQLALLGAGLLAHHISPGESSTALHLDEEAMESQRGTTGRLSDETEGANRTTGGNKQELDPAGNRQTQGTATDPDPRGIRIGDDHMIRGNEHAPVDHFIDDENRLIQAPRVADQPPKGRSIKPDAPAPNYNIHRAQVLSDADVEALRNLGVQPGALEKLKSVEIGALDQMGIKPEQVSKLYKQLRTSQAKGGVAVDFVNQFHEAPGFESLVLAWARGGKGRNGANFAMKYSLGNLRGRPVRFEWPVSQAVTGSGAEGTMAARYVDIVVDGGNSFRPGQSLRIEIKSWTERYLSTRRAPGQIAKQLVRDVAFFQQDNIRWVFDSSKASRNAVLDAFVWAIRNDGFLSKSWQGAESDLRSALGNLIEMYRP